MLGPQKLCTLDIRLIAMAIYHCHPSCFVCVLSVPFFVFRFEALVWQYRRLGLDQLINRLVCSAPGWVEQQVALQIGDRLPACLIVEYTS